MKKKPISRSILSMAISVSVFIFNGTEGLCTGRIQPQYPSKAQSFSQIEHNSELSNMSVMDIVQDTRGFLWIATLKGLNRYDGNSITQYYETPGGIPSNDITSLLSVGDSIWIGTDKGLSIYDSRRDRFAHMDSLNTGGIHDISLIGEENIVFGTENGLFILNAQTKASEKVDDANIYKLTTDKYGTIWAITDSNVKTYSATGKEKMIIYDHASSSERISPSAIYSDLQGSIWLGTMNDGIYKYDKEAATFIPYDIPGFTKQDVKYVRCMNEDLQGNLWIGTENGLFIHDLYSGTCKHYTKEKKSSVFSSINDNALYTIFLSREGIMWIGTFFGGVNCSNTYNSHFKEITDENGDRFLDGAAVSHIFCDSRKRLWFATENEGVYVHDLKTRQTRALNTQTRPGLKGNNTHAIAEDPYGNIWIGNFVDGLHRFSLDLDQSPDLFLAGGQKYALPENSIYSLLADNKDSLFIGLEYGLATYNYHTGRFRSLEHDVLNSERIDDIHRDRDGNVWLATHFNGIFRYDSLNRIRHYSKRSHKNMSSDLIFCCFEDSAGDMWFGTNNGGLLKYNKTSQDFLSFGALDALKQRNIYFIEEDFFGNLWLSTDRGIFSFDPSSGTFNNYKLKTSPVSNQFNYNAGYKNPVQGMIYLGSINGACCFQPEEIIMDKTENFPKIIFSDFKIHNNSIIPGEDAPLKQAIDYTSDIVLRHNENSVSFEFKYIDFGIFMPNSFVCEYRLDNEDAEWITAGNPQICNYSKLTPGKYTFKTRVVDNDGNTLEARTIRFRIKPHILLSPGFYLLYTLLGLAMLFLILKIYRNRMNDKLALQIEQIEKQNLETINRHRINFFTYISHEFKSPLTILLAILEDIEKSGNERRISSQETEIITHNTRRLIFLINQLMEFRSIETNHEKINYIKGDIINFCDKIFQMFIPLFRQNGLHHEFRSSHPSFITTFDNDKIEKIISNLLSNAVKHSIPIENEISVSFNVLIDEKKQTLTFSCHNKGSYIPKEQRETILQPFFKTEATKAYSYNNGIGLALVKELVDLLKGKIVIDSDMEKGTTFTVTMPFVSDIAEIEVSPIESVNTKNTSEIIGNTIYDVKNLIQIQNENGSGSMSDNQKTYTILIVDDDVEMGQMLKSRLKGGYHIKRANNGLEALEIVKDTDIDMIICDIFMPGMNGFEVCLRIKGNAKTKHIPVILMTSEDSKESEIKGLQMGADEYLRKPFSIEELNLRITNLLNSKRSIKEYYNSISHNIETGGNSSNKDENFINQLTNLIVENMTDSSLNVDFLADNMNISRTKLYMRLKSITGMSATEFINKVKIDIAMKKLMNDESSINEIAWRSGYNSPNYFSRIFRKYAGCSPSEFMKKRRKN